jgi:hypothetical protein
MAQKDNDWIHKAELWLSKKQQETHHTDLARSDLSRWDVGI